MRVVPGGILMLRFAGLCLLCGMLVACADVRVNDPVYKSITPDHVLCTVDCRDTDGAFGINSKNHHAFVIETEPSDKAPEEKAVKSVTTLQTVSVNSVGPAQALLGTALGSSGNAAVVGAIDPYLPQAKTDVSVSTGASSNSKK
jgi:hypothetical protein